MKHNRYDDDGPGERRTGRPPLPADAIYRQQQQRDEMFDALDDLVTIGKTEGNEAAGDVDAEPFPPDSKVEGDDQSGDDEDAYHPTTLQPSKERNV